MTSHVTTSMVADEVARALGARPERVELIPTGEWNTVWRVALGDRRLILKAHGEGDVLIESWAYGRVRAAGVPAPEVLHTDTSARTFPDPYLIMEEAPGVPLHSLGAPRPALLELGRAMRRLHTIEIEGFGWLDRKRFKETGEVRGVGDSERALARADRWAIDYLEERGLLAAGEVTAARALIERESEALDGTRSVLLHADLGTDHVFVDPGTLRINAIIDFGDARAGDPIWEFACMSIHEPQQLGAVLEGYDPDPDLAAALPARLALYRFVRQLGEARWMHERTMDVTRSLARIRARLAEEGS